MDIISIPPSTAAHLARATGFRLVEVVTDAFEAGHTIDVQVSRRSDGRFVLGVVTHEGERVEQDVEFALGQLVMFESEVQAAILWTWAGTIAARVSRSRARVERAVAAGRT